MHGHVLSHLCDQVAKSCLPCEAEKLSETLGVNPDCLVLVSLGYSSPLTSHCSGKIGKSGAIFNLKSLAMVIILLQFNTLYVKC